MTDRSIKMLWSPSGFLYRSLMASDSGLSPLSSAGLRNFDVLATPPPATESWEPRRNELVERGDVVPAPISPASLASLLKSSFASARGSRSRSAGTRRPAPG